MKYLVAIDGSSHADAAFEHGCKTIKDGDEIFLVTVVAPNQPPPMMQVSTDVWEAYVMKENEYLQFAQELLAEYKEKSVALLPEGIVPTCKAVQGKSPREELIKLCLELEIDCVFVGSRGMGKLKQILLGSVSQFMIESAPCDVHICKTPSQKKQKQEEAEASNAE